MSTPHEYFPPHHHDAGELIWSPTGVCSVATMRGTWVASAELAVWVPAGEWHDANALRGVAWLTVPNSDFAAYPDRPCAVLITPRLRNAMSRLLWEGNDPSSDAFSALREEITESNVARLPLLVVPLERQSALQSMDGVPASLHHCASALGISRSTLLRWARRELGTSFGRWQRLMSMRRAMESLALGERVKVVAERGGYRSPSAFVAAFRQMLGMTPKCYALQAARASARSRRGK